MPLKDIAFARAGANSDVLVARLDGACRGLRDGRP
jgi:hypothetical protein